MAAEPNTIDAQACSWVTRRDGGLTAAEMQAFDAWLAADNRHRGAFIRAQAAWLDTSRVAALAGGADLCGPTDMPGVETGPSHGAFKSRTARTGWLVAASVILVLGVGAFTAREQLFSHSKIYASEVGEVRNIELTDGSQLALNTNTRAIVRFNEARRDIALDKGEALFSVAHDATRPFMVHANNVTVRALGTAFSVRVDDTRTDVLVTEGVVEISRSDVAGLETIQRVAANHRVMLASSESRPDIEPVSADAVARELAWRDGMAAFAGEPLGAAVAEINRHSHLRIYIDDPALAARPVIGIFHAKDAEAFADAAGATFGARVTHVHGEIHLGMGATQR